MAKAILIIDVPDDCAHLSALITCGTEEGIHIHELEYEEDEIDRRVRAFETLKDHLEALRID